MFTLFHLISMKRKTIYRWICVEIKHQISLTENQEPNRQKRIDDPNHIPLFLKSYPDDYR